MKNVDIFGTCLTRELFNVSANYKVNTYLMQQSIFTMFSKPLSIAEKKARSLDNYNFKNRMIYYELNKIGIYKLLESPSEYLIIDLADVGRDILRFDIPNGIELINTQDVLFTLSSLDNCKTFKYCVFNVQDFNDQELRNMLQKFIEFILTKYDKNKIILNKVQMQNVYYDDFTEKRIDNCFIYNRLSFIKRVEEIFIELLPECKILYSRYEPILDINHRLGGPHPAHFEKIYYEYKMHLLDALITGKDSVDEIEDSYINIYNNEINKIKAKKLIR